ncbi:eukaryotic translation initiation factor 2D [Trichogramma pretiosum]|uniref:eukaryotic translation initiation factor 2D n=1 Tax=Trichogramma pretiosum TaxID=7493 RepID=UPI0006C9547A|nr:eukaryotic translation initiation factor 2D [Trichogramma pretiosum]
MFTKAFRVKSNNQLKGTERKKLSNDLNQAYPSLQQEDIQKLLPKKEVISVVKVVTHSEKIVKIYYNDKIPLFFQIDSSSILFPTIFTLWNYPGLLYSYITRTAVVRNLTNGANLMLPGVVIDGPIKFHSYGKLSKGTPVSIITEDNKAPVAVGFTSLSSEDMYMSNGHGKCVDIMHVFGDYLCDIDKAPLRPNLGPAFLPPTESTDLQTEDITTNSEINNQMEMVNLNEPSLEEKKILDNTIANNKNEAAPASEETSLNLDDGKDDLVKEMDQLLQYCFIKAIKTTFKKGDLPIITSTFFKNHVIRACPPGSSVDVKKSSYKKLSVFLAHLKNEGLIDTSSIKGVESLIYIKYDHPLIKNLTVMEEAVIEENTTTSPVISECYKVTAAVAPILSKFGFEKGDILKRQEIRKCFTDYVKKENLQDGKTLKIDPLLADVLKTKESQLTITMEDGINKFIGKMTHTHEVTVGGKTIFYSGKLEPIDITVATRSGNKKVTLINNLEVYGIKLDEFSKECQGIGASATITDVPGKKTPSVLVQGNQVLYVYKLLTEKYNINKNHIKGLEFAPKKKK